MKTDKEFAKTMLKPSNGIDKQRNRDMPQPKPIWA